LIDDANRVSTKALGLIPPARGLDAGTEPNQRLALAVVGGLTSSTLLSLFLAPVMFLLVARRSADIENPALLAIPGIPPLPS